MKLSVSNIAWDPAELADHLALLRDLGCDGVELAPSCIWPEPVEAEAEERARIKTLIQRTGLDVTGFHSLLYTRPDLQLFKDHASLREMVAYLNRLVHLCADLDGRLLIFGSPRNRVRHGRSVEECLAWAAEAFTEVAEKAGRCGVSLCIEPLGPSETDFIQSSLEGAALVERVGHPNFRLHLDTKALVGSGEDVEAVLAHYGGTLRHFHVSDPGLAPPGSAGIDHARIGRALCRSGYQGFVSLEMRR
ncbi:MAG TPA: hypothetical protein DDX89_07480, partial [Candidatus Omnitrophica bacterium]|nr:hypothetical protein [Candidatus Omnitrophota bacterium]